MVIICFPPNVCGRAPCGPHSDGESMVLRVVCWSPRLHPQISFMFWGTSHPAKGETIEGKKRGWPCPRPGWWKVLEGAASRQLGAAEWKPVHRHGLNSNLRCISHHWKLEMEVQSPKTHLLFNYNFIGKLKKILLWVTEAEGTFTLTGPESEALAWKLPIRKIVMHAKKPAVWHLNLDVNTRVWKKKNRFNVILRNVTYKGKSIGFWSRHCCH